MGTLQVKNRTRASFNNIPTKYISGKSLINVLYEKNIILAIFSFSMCWEAVRRETTEGSSIEFIGYQIPQYEQSGSIAPKIKCEISGLKIMAGHQTMSGQDDYLSRQNLGLVVILTGHVRGKNLFTLFLENINSSHFIIINYYMALSHKDWELPNSRI